jgi:hypothetical protein
MARTYYITAPPAVAGSHIRYTAHEVRCIVALFSLRSQASGLRRWLRLRWWLLISSERVIRHVRACTYRQYFASQRRRQRVARRESISLIRGSTVFDIPGLSRSNSRIRSQDRR